MALFAMSVASAQVKFGAKVGLNLAMQSYTSAYTGAVNPTNDPKVGFHIGGLAEIKLADKFAIQPELLVSFEGSKQSSTFSDFDYTSKEEHKVNLTYINVPVMFKYYVIDKLSVEAGPQVGILASAKDKYEYTETSSGVVTSSSKTVDVKNIYKSVNFGFNIGAGYNFTDHLSAGLRYNIGLSDVGQAGTVDYGDGPEAQPKYYKVKNNVFQVSLAYMF